MVKGVRLVVRCVDLVLYRWELDEELVIVGGCVCFMVWDLFGERLVVVFKGLCILGQGKGYFFFSIDVGLSIYYVNV